MSHYSTDDLTVVMLESKKKRLLVASCYMTHDKTAPPEELRSQVEASPKDQQIFVGADGNAHHCVWGRPDINERGKTCPDAKITTLMGPKDWRTAHDRTRYLNIYTDGSKMEGGVGPGIYCTDPETRLSYKLPSQCSIFQAEVFTIRKVAELAQRINRPH
ncbi:hypothetical protein KR032_001795 [Drosophila birchii]|nr:hypothetical protein KR032_001795 [Drosophila birchii]